MNMMITKWIVDTKNFQRKPEITEKNPFCKAPKEVAKLQEGKTSLVSRVGFLQCQTLPDERCSKPLLVDD